MSDVSLSEAAKATGKSAVTLRGFINSGKLKSHKQNGQHRVNLNDVLALLGQRSTINGRVGASAREGSDAIEPQALISALQSQLKQLIDERDFLRHLLEQQQELLAQEKSEKKILMSELMQRTAEIKALLENKPGLFRIFERK